MPYAPWPVIKIRMSSLSAFNMKIAQSYQAVPRAESLKPEADSEAASRRSGARSIWQ